MNTTVTRSLSGIVFLAVMIGCLVSGQRWCFNLLFLFIDVVMMWEFLHITMGGEHKHIQYITCAVAGLAFISVGLCTGAAALPAKWLCINLVSILVLMVAMVFNHSGFKHFSYAFTALLYIALPLALSHFVVAPGGVYDCLLLLAFFILIWASDTGAYCFGMLLGQKVWPAKLCPEISPKKSWAGAIGGLLASLLAAALLRLAGWLPFPLVHVLVLSALMNVTGVFGDLFESLWKRQFGVKDSGNIMPGHGGLLDRFDSALFAIPTGYVYLLFFNLV